ncbi:hypothetical protein JOF56_001296 [Kibdelosporangium banguiense]|uniref:Uncharacterized protein n=1 Tax=Kibdelosporangium banguiense TaxID=1365924 RepID=A0ABS4T910_9PSEU|nr:hypothetical protein [Kibdelosporangium banguiense]MBP2320911.1 hypothetical protein [Kibdelosporangium banguiense]
MRPLHSILTALATGLVAWAVAKWLMVLPVFWAVTVALPVMACTFVATALAGVAAPTWKSMPAKPESLTAHQASVLSSRLAGVAKDPGRYTSKMQPRLRTLAQSVLRHRHGVVSLADPRARDLLGTELHDLITKADAKLPSPHRLAQLLSRLEEK